MVETYYSIKNKIDAQEPIVKHPGTISGQSFDIENCSGCRIVILDHCEQVQIDNATNCQIFIGASASSIFLRNCEDCTLYSCSRQLRLRECFNCAFYVFSMSEVHIELCKDVVFAPFSGGYKEHKQHLDAAGLDLSLNHWNQIYDHSDADNEMNHWNLLPIHDRNSPWFPDGSSVSCFGDDIELTTNASSGTVLNTEGTQSYGMDQLIRDHNELLRRKQGVVEESSQTVREKTAIDFSILPLKSSGDGVKQLGIEVALLIAAATAKGIDVAIWLTDMPGISTIPATEFNTKLTSLGLAVGIHESWEAKRELDLATSKGSLKTIFSLCGHFCSESGVPMIDVSLFLRLSLERVEEHLRHIQLGIVSAESPAKDNKLSPAKASPAEQARPNHVESPKHSNDPIDLPTPVVIPIPTPKKSETKPLSISHDQEQISFRGQDKEHRRRGRSVDNRISVEAVVSSIPRRSKSRESVKTRNSIAMTGLSSEEFESFIKKTVQKTDLYHLIQVYLGYIKPYCIIPARGNVVISKPRVWLTVRDLQRAFLAARVNLSDNHVRKLMQLVCEFSRNTKKISIGGEATNSVSDISGEREGEEKTKARVESEYAECGDNTRHAVTRNGRLNSEWFKQYLVHLRLIRPSIPWVEWLGGKLKQDESLQDDKPKEFRRALAGKTYSLSRAEINKLLLEYELIPEEALKDEIERRAEAYVFDIHGRMDFQHKFNIKIRQWRKGLTTKPSSQEIDNQTTMISEELRKERYQDLLASERKDASISKELFWTFDLACRESSYTLKCNFGDWLKDYSKKASKHVESVKLDFHERVHSSSLRTLRKHNFAPLNRLCDCISNIADILPQAPQIQFRKAIISLKREAATEGIAGGKLVSKTVFDKNFEALLLGPYQQALYQDSTLRDLTVEARKSHEWRRSEDDINMDPSESTKNCWTKTPFNNIFTSSISEALESSDKFEMQKASENDSRYAAWVEEKLEAKRQLKKIEVI